MAPMPFRVRLLVNEFAGSRESPSHTHPEGQLVAVHSGVVLMETPAGRWAQAPGCVGWIPPHHPHSARSFGPTSGWSLYLTGGFEDRLPNAPAILEASVLIEELFKRLTQLSTLELTTPRGYHLINVILDELACADTQHRHLPIPGDRHLARLASALINDPSDNSTLDEWAGRLGLSRRTLTRRFVSETGMSFGDWRKQLRLFEALGMLSDGASVSTTALSIGFESVSAFIACFRKYFKVTPGRIFDRLGERPVNGQDSGSVTPFASDIDRKAPESSASR
jgi:AraC-like DNA-binding protein